MVINGARVLHGEESKNTDSYGRSALLVPRNLQDEILLSLTWIGKEYQLNLMAETYIDSVEANKQDEPCILSFAHTKCKGMEHLSSRDTKVLGETMKINANLFYDSDDKTLIKNKKVMIYVMDTSESQTPHDISSSNAMISINLPDVGMLT